MDQEQSRQYSKYKETWARNNKLLSSAVNKAVYIAIGIGMRVHKALITDVYYKIYQSIKKFHFMGLFIFGFT